MNKMTEQEFNYLIGGVKNVMENHLPKDYRLYTCGVISNVFGKKHPAVVAYKKFINPHLAHGTLFLQEQKDLWPYLRILIIQAFEDEIRSTRIYEKWPSRIKYELDINGDIILTDALMLTIRAEC